MTKGEIFTQQFLITLEGLVRTHHISLVTDIKNPFPSFARTAGVL